MRFCPACTQPMQAICDFPYHDFDGSLFSRSGAILHCAHCGLGAVASGLTDDIISDYYAEDCLYSAMSGVGVGGGSPEDLARYARYAQLLEPYISEIAAGSGFVDVGCSRGGLLVDLKSRFPGLPLMGIDVDTQSLAALEGTGIASRAGSALSIPLPDRSQQMLAYFHVFEHILDTDRVLAEATRVLKDDGLLMIEVPDASSYGAPATRVGTMFWLGLKEHVYHFTAPALTLMLARHGLSVLEVVHSQVPMRGATAYPSLILIARRDGGTAHPTLDTSVRDALPQHVAAEHQSLARQVSALDAFIADRKEIAIWGIGLEFLNLWAHNGSRLKKDRTVRLLDSSPAKQKRRVDGTPVEAPSAGRDGEALICCSYQSTASILSGADALGWKRDNIFVLQ